MTGHIIVIVLGNNRSYILAHIAYSAANLRLKEINGFLRLVIHNRLDYIHMCIVFLRRSDTSIY